MSSLREGRGGRGGSLDLGRGYHCVGQFCLVPMGVEASVTRYVVRVQEVLERCRRQGELTITYELGPNGTSIEGPWDDVFAAIRQCHEALHEDEGFKVPRIHTTISVGTRMDKASSIKAKLQSVQDGLKQRAG